MNPFLIWSMVVAVCLSCSMKEAGTADNIPLIQSGNWLFELELHDGVQLPVNVRVTGVESPAFEFINGTEVLKADARYTAGDSLVITMPYFDSEFRAVLDQEGATMKGDWYNLAKGSDYKIPFTARVSEATRFCNRVGEGSKLKARYAVQFSPRSEEDRYPAVGMFDQNTSDQGVTGTFATETGDYRFLQGNICEDVLMLSCFDGSHAFLFTADISGDSLVNGVFYSGSHWQEPWEGKSSDDFTLRDPDMLTQVVDSASIMKIQVIMEDGSVIPISELTKPGEVLLVQIMGTWCPNCLDESRFFKELHSSYSTEGLKILPIAFENSSDHTIAYKAIHRLEKDLDLPYPIYFAGSRAKSNASEKIPALNHIMSYPTSILIDAHGKVRNVHTGFYGPSTGIYYDQYVSSSNALIRELLSEK